MKVDSKRFKNDIKYDLAIPPMGLDFYRMTPKQSEEFYKWFISIIDKRMNYFRNRCALDSNISKLKLDYSAESLKLVWRWFLGIARIEETPKDLLKQMEDGAKIFGESYINREQFTPVTSFIMRDIGIYIGQSYILNHPQLYWHYYIKPKNDINAKQPVLGGFYYNDNNIEGSVNINPMNLVEGAAANMFYKKQNELDLYNYYIKYERWIPKV